MGDYLRKNESVQRVREAGEGGKLGGVRDIGALGEAIDPYGGEAERVGGGEVVEGAGGDVDVAVFGGAGALEEALPVAVGGLVGAGIGGGDGQVDRDADLAQ